MTLNSDALGKCIAQSQQTLRERMDRYVGAWNAGDLDTILSFFVDEGLDYSDYGGYPTSFGPD